MPFGLYASNENLPDRPVLHLSGPRLTRSFETLVERSEDHGGIESYIKGLQFKSAVIGEAVSDDKFASLNEKDFLGICAFMASVRRRVGPWIARAGMDKIRSEIAQLLENATDTTTTDARLDTFCAAFPDDKSYRWARDLAAEILHSAYPEHYPLMNRWVWDETANTGVLREIWHGEDVDRMTLKVPDSYQTYIVLREELSQFLASNGVYRDMLFY
ncbi:MAG: hypothetical protein OXQ30_15150, partial [Boseongicola sp.]|nr:hypothetical protein [Boseongicola sp.]